MFMNSHKGQMPSASDALPGRDLKMPMPSDHYVNGHPLEAPFPEGMKLASFGLGCFWGAERKFWEADGVYSTAVGYAAGYTPNPTYKEVCSGKTGHNEVVLVVFDSAKTSYEKLLKIFWEAHDPTQGMQQGNDAGTQYRSGIYCYNEEQLQQAVASKEIFQKELITAGRNTITTEIIPAEEFYYAEDYHQQYLAKNPNGYCGLGGSGVKYPSSTISKLKEFLHV